jgi:hypothetical protein
VLVNSDSVLAMSNNVQYSVELVGSPLNAIIGKEGVFYTRLKCTGDKPGCVAVVTPGPPPLGARRATPFRVNPVRCWCLTLCTADCPPPPPAHRVAYLNPMNAARQEVSMEEKNQSIN